MCCLSSSFTIPFTLSPSTPFALSLSKGKRSLRTGLSKGARSGLRQAGPEPSRRAQPERDSCKVISGTAHYPPRHLSPRLSLLLAGFPVGARAIDVLLATITVTYSLDAADRPPLPAVGEGRGEGFQGGEQGCAPSYLRRADHIPNFHAKIAKDAKTSRHVPLSRVGAARMFQIRPERVSWNPVQVLAAFALLIRRILFSWKDLRWILRPQITPQPSLRAIPRRRAARWAADTARRGRARGPDPWEPALPRWKRGSVAARRPEGWSGGEGVAAADHPYRFGCGPEAALGALRENCNAWAYSET